MAGSSFSRSWCGLVLEEVHLAEQVQLLLAVEQRHLVEAGQVGGSPLGALGRRGALPSAGAGIGARISACGLGVVEARVAG